DLYAVTFSLYKKYKPCQSIAVQVKMLMLKTHLPSTLFLANRRNGVCSKRNPGLPMPDISLVLQHESRISDHIGWQAISVLISEKTKKITNQTCTTSDSPTHRANAYQNLCPNRRPLPNLPKLVCPIKRCP